jgi:hypothetical protein
MDELERRLRSALADMAEEVPSSHHAWAEHQRRVAAKSRRDRRRPVLMAAAAAAVVALIAVPTVILNTRGKAPTQEAGQGPPTASSAPSTETTKSSRTSVPPEPKYVGGPGETVVTEPFVLTGTSKNNVANNTYVYTVRVNNSVRLCTLTQPVSAGNVVDGNKVRPEFCATLFPPAQGKYFWGNAIVVPQAPDMYIYVASPPTDKILLKEPDGSYAAAIGYGHSTELSIFCTAGGIKKPIAYSALDPAGNALENR